MNRLLFTAIACLIAGISIAQNPATIFFKSEVGHFSFDYPSYLESKKINNSLSFKLKYLLFFILYITLTLDPISLFECCL